MADNGARAASAARDDRQAAKLPDLSVAHMEEATKLVERLIDEKRSLFLDNAAKHRQAAREASERPLTAIEAGQIAAGLAAEMDVADPAQFVEGIQASGLRAQDEPDRQEVLLAAGLATAPAFMDIALRLLALVEMPAGDLEAACELQRLDDELAERSAELRKLPIREARQRVTDALAHVNEQAGISAGKVLSLIAQLVGQALSMALGPSPTDSGLSSLTGSLEPTDGLDETSSTEPPIETQQDSSVA